VGCAPNPEPCPEHFPELVSGSFQDHFRACPEFISGAGFMMRLSATSSQDYYI
jgi:hypothetical protein